MPARHFSACCAKRPRDDEKLDFVFPADSIAPVDSGAPILLDHLTSTLIDYPDQEAVLGWPPTRPTNRVDTGSPRLFGLWVP